MAVRLMALVAGAARGCHLDSPVGSKATRSFGLQREFPWGATRPGTANAYAIYGCYYPTESGMCDGQRNIAPVGNAVEGAGLWGQLDLAGEVQEWNLDWDFEDVNPCVNCAYLSDLNESSSAFPTPISAGTCWTSSGSTSRKHRRRNRRSGSSTGARKKAGSRGRPRPHRGHRLVGRESGQFADRISPFRRRARSSTSALGESQRRINP